jgi:hypothetical protein
LLLFLLSPPADLKLLIWLHGERLRLLDLVLASGVRAAFRALLGFFTFVPAGVNSSSSPSGPSSLL